MPDYNIYIHSANGSTTSPTKPWQPGNTQTSSLNEENNEAIQKAWKVVSIMNYAQNPDTLISKGTSAIEKAVPWIAVAKAVISIIDNAITSAIDYGALETGNYRQSIAWDNFKTTLTNITHPFSFVQNRIRIGNRNRIENYRRQEQRLLLGDSDINAYTNRGV